MEPYTWDSGDEIVQDFYFYQKHSKEERNVFQVQMIRVNTGWCSCLEGLQVYNKKDGVENSEVCKTEEKDSKNECCFEDQYAEVHIISKSDAFTSQLSWSQEMPHWLQFTSKELSFACLQWQPQMTGLKPMGAMRELIHAVPGAPCDAK